MRLGQDQLRAVKAAPGPTRVLAGAGTGKTAVIVERFFRLLAEGCEPGRILVMTFTERAAGEMRSRIERRLPGESELAIGTFHALAQRWLREEAPAARVPAGFRILSGAERWILTWDLMWELGDPALCDVEHPENQVGPVLRLLERMKQELISLPRVEAAVRALEAGERRDVLGAATRLIRAYERACRKLKVLDFDDLLARTVRLLEQRADVRERFQQRYPWVLVDEYQDTNLAQERMVELIAGPAGRVFVVGDDDQSIYRFRGASRASLERFAATFPDARTITLERNRRSTSTIVAASSALVSRNADRLPKRLSAVRRGGPLVEIWACADAWSESQAIAAEIGRLARDSVPLEQIAVLTRTNAIAAPLARALQAAGIACRSPQWWGLFDRAGSKDLLAALRLVREPADAIAGERLRDGLGALSRQGWARLRSQLAEGAARWGVGDLFFELMERSGYLEGASAELVTDALRFGDLVTGFADNAADQSLAAFLRHVELVELSGLEIDARAGDGDARDGDDAVSVMTIHQAKGLEFEAVFAPALVDGRLPQPPRRSRLDLPASVLEPAVRGREDHLAEERRLCYVAMTRARSRLYLSWAEAYEGERVWRPSPFLAEIATGAPRAVLEKAVEVAPAGGEQPPQSGPAGPRPPCGSPLTVSFSSLHAYRECPRLYWYRYVRRLASPATAEGHLGDAVHRALQQAGVRRAGGARVSEAEMREWLAQAWCERPFPAPRQEKAFRRAGEAMVARYVREGGFERVPLRVEMPFEVPVDGFRLRGVIDRIDDQGEGGGHLVIDYKTGASLPVSRLRRDFQLALYASAARRQLGLDTIELEIAYLRDGKRVRLPASSELLAEAEAVAAQAVAGIRAERFEPRPERRRCRACAYRLACDASM